MKYIFCYTVNLSSISVYFQTLCNQLSQRGHNVIVITDRNIKERCLLEDSVKMFDWPNVRPVKFADFRFFSRLVKSVRPIVFLRHLNRQFDYS
ncbi:MAG: glycosyltransferase family 4 protein [Marinilabiliaceae bacterium]|nr:glycosyltransferase family 4 protein [Marinilabiliaceae bacterium]